MERIESPVYRRLGNTGLVVPSVGHVDHGRGWQGQRGDNQVRPGHGQRRGIHRKLAVRAFHVVELAPVETRHVGLRE